MAINPQCDMCKQELSDFGGIILSPPDEQSKVKKYHLCKACYSQVEAKLESNKR